jgi:hypothetical protein
MELSPDEQAVIDYHRSNLWQGRGMKNPDGSITTFKGSVVGADGGHMILPTYWHGQVRDIPKAMRFAIKSGIKFPIYPTVDEALAAEQRLHGIMEQDLRDYNARPQPKKMK